MIFPSGKSASDMVEQQQQTVHAAFATEVKELFAEIKKNPAIGRKLLAAFELGANMTAYAGGLEIKPVLEDLEKRLALLEVERLPNLKRKARPEPVNNIVAIALYLRGNPTQTQEEIAKGLGYTLATVRRYSNRARKLAKLLEDGTIEI